MSQLTELHNSGQLLLPCPFCGSATAQQNLGWHEANSIESDNECSESFGVICNVGRGGCGASGGYALHKKLSADKWNRRERGMTTPSEPQVLGDPVDFAYILTNLSFTLRTMHLAEWIDKAKHHILDLESKLRLATASMLAEPANHTLLPLNEHQLAFLDAVITIWEDSAGYITETADELYERKDVNDMIAMIRSSLLSHAGTST